MICNGCGRDLDPSTFYRNNRRDRHLQPCKECWRQKYKRSEAGRIANRKATSQWKKTEAGKASNRRALAKFRHSPQGKSWRAEWEAGNPDKVRAHFTKWNRKQSYLRKLAKALRLITIEALNK